MLDWILDWPRVAEFSRVNCVTICAFLVPANLIATLQTLIFIELQLPRLKLGLITGCASFYAVLMIVHVYTWFDIGVVKAPTFILLFLGSLCLGLNTWAIAHPISLSQLLRYGLSRVVRFRQAILSR
ncbi:MAG: hypothetical protein ACRC8A_06890 [Microcoleaceae cyanobacterium]